MALPETRDGLYEISLAIIILILLLLGNIVAVINEQNLQTLDTRNQPPTNGFFQWLLMRPSMQLAAMDDNTATGLDFYSDSQETGHVPETAMASAGRPSPSRPCYTAIVGQPYIQRLLEKEATEFRYSLIRGPEGMKIDGDGLIVWTPEAHQTGVEKVEIGLTSAAGIGTRWNYEIYISKKPHWLGTDRAGRDILSCLILGSKWSLLPGLLAVFVSIPLTLLFGGVAGYYGGAVESLLSYGITMFSAIPSLVLIFLTGAILNFNIYPMMAVLGIIVFPRYALQIKNKVLTMKENQFIEAAKELGLNDRHILCMDILWYNARAQVLAFSFQIMAFAILIEVTLSYLNLGIKEPSVSWGKMLFDHRSMIHEQKFWPLLFPALAIFIAVGSFYLLADGINKRNKIRGV